MILTVFRSRANPEVQQEYATRAHAARIATTGLTMAGTWTRSAALALLLCGARALAAQPDDIVGIWFNE